MVTRLLLPHPLYFCSFKLLICEVETINLGMLGYLPLESYNGFISTCGPLHPSCLFSLSWFPGTLILALFFKVRYFENHISSPENHISSSDLNKKMIFIFNDIYHIK